jgi:clan AA aspartic protease
VTVHGAVTTDGREPVLPLAVLGVDGSSARVEVEALVDTGFDGELALPPGLVRRLGHPYAGSTAATLADGSAIQLDYHEGRVLWHGEERAVAVLASDGDPPGRDGPAERRQAHGRRRAQRRRPHRGAASVASRAASELEASLFGAGYPSRPRLEPGVGHHLVGGRRGYRSHLRPFIPLLTRSLTVTYPCSTLATLLVTFPALLAASASLKKH